MLNDLQTLPLLRCYTMGQPHLHIFSSSKIWIKFASNWWILLMIELACGLPLVAVLARILHSSSIKVFLISWPRSSDPQSYVISDGQWYLYRHIVPTNITAVLALLLLYWVTLDHPVTEFVVVMDSSIKISFYFLRIL